MPVSEALTTRLDAIQAALMAHHKGGGGMPAASKGAERETFLREFLEKVLPPTYRFGAGAVTDSSGAISGQLDVVIEYPNLPSFPMPGGSDRLYMAESVAAVISVKSNLSSQWSEVEAECSKVEPLRRKFSGGVASSGGGISFLGDSSEPIPFIAVGYTGYKTIEGLRERLEKTPEHKRPTAALCIETGLWVAPPDGYATGHFGLFGLAMTLTLALHGLVARHANIQAYFSGQ